MLSKIYRDMQGLVEVVRYHTAAVSIRINPPKMKIVSVPIADEQRLAVLFDSLSLENVAMFKYLGSMFIANTPGYRKGFNLPVQHSLACIHILGLGVIYRCTQREGLTRLGW